MILNDLKIQITAHYNQHHIAVILNQIHSLSPDHVLHLLPTLGNLESIGEVKMHDLVIVDKLQFGNVCSCSTVWPNKGMYIVTS